MKRLVVSALAAVAALVATPAPAAADGTAFLGLSPTSNARSASGAALGFKFIFLDFEFEYAHMTEGLASNTPGFSSGMFNIALETPTKTKIYLTAGGGLTHENLGAATRWGVGTDIGGGVKLPLAGPIRLRLDYRVFTLHNGIPSAPNKMQYRFYAGLNVAF